jgi:hypothetical protein
MKSQNIDVPKEAIAHFCQHWHITKAVKQSTYQWSQGK